ncbi:MAG: hypothetical protein AB1582_12900 [Pseudomonadota bacterium]
MTPDVIHFIWYVARSPVPSSSKPLLFAFQLFEYVDVVLEAAGWANVSVDQLSKLFSEDFAIEGHIQLR